jgi:hypothetical protein
MFVGMVLTGMMFMGLALLNLAATPVPAKARVRR